MTDYIIKNNDLYHYGIPGMRWGHRKRTPLETSNTRSKYDNAKSKLHEARINKRSANAAYSKTFDDSRKLMNQFGSRKKQYNKALAKTANDSNKADSKYKKAKNDYKKAKKERNTQINNTYKDITKKSSISEKIIFSDGTRQKAAKYVVDNNMSIDQAYKRTKKQAVINTSAMLAAGLGAMTISSIMYK